MDLSDPTMRMGAVIVVVTLFVAFLTVQPTPLVKWWKKKNYQYEVTMSLYMMTPTEKFAFNSIMFLTLSMLLIACTLYLPNHVMTISRRTYYYFVGDTALFTSSLQAAETFYDTAAGAGEAVLDAATGWAHVAYQAARNKTMAAAQVAASQAAENLAPVWQ